MTIMAGMDVIYGLSKMTSNLQGLSGCGHCSVLNLPISEDSTEHLYSTLPLQPVSSWQAENVVEQFYNGKTRTWFSLEEVLPLV